MVDVLRGAFDQDGHIEIRDSLVQMDEGSQVVVGISRGTWTRGITAVAIDPFDDEVDHRSRCLGQEKRVRRSIGLLIPVLPGEVAQPLSAHFLPVFLNREAVGRGLRAEDEDGVGDTRPRSN